MARGGLVEPRQLGGRLEPARAVELAAVERSTTMNVGTRSTRYRWRQLGLLVDIDRLDRISVADQLLDGRPHLLARSAPFGVKVEQDGLGRRVAGRGSRRRSSRASNREAMVMPPGLLSLGSGRRPTPRRRRGRAGPARCHAPRDEAMRTFRWLGLWPRGGAPGRRLASRARAWPRRRWRGRTASAGADVFAERSRCDTR